MHALVQRVAVEADYGDEQAESRSQPASTSGFFFCEAPADWIETPDRLPERLLAIGRADLKDLCAFVNERERAARPEGGPERQMSPHTIKVTVLTWIEMQAHPWRFARHPLRYPSRCLLVHGDGSFAAIDSEAFEERASNDLQKMREERPSAQEPKTEEVVVRDICGRSFLYYGESLITQKPENHASSDYYSSAFYLFRFALYRRSSRELVMRKEEILSVDFGENETVAIEHFLSADGGVTWNPSGGLADASLLGLEAAWSLD